MMVVTVGVGIINSSDVNNDIASLQLGRVARADQF